MGFTGGNTRLVDDDFYSAAHGAADKRGKEVERLFLSGVRRLAAEIDEDALVDGLIRDGADGALEAIGPVGEFFDPIGPVLEDVFADAGERSAEDTARELRAGALRDAREVDVDEIGLVFDRANPRAVQAAREITAKLIVEVEESFREAVRHQVERGLVEGIAPRDLAGRIIDQGLGLTRRQLDTVEKFRTRLIDQGVEGSALDRRVGRYYEAQLRRRARTIARTETMTAADQGQLELWRQTKDAGLITAAAQKEWIVTPDDRLDVDICEPMDGVRVGLEDPWILPDGRQVMTPAEAHPQDRCGMSLVPA